MHLYTKIIVYILSAFLGCFLFARHQAGVCEPENLEDLSSSASNNIHTGGKGGYIFIRPIKHAKFSGSVAVSRLPANRALKLELIDSCGRTVDALLFNKLIYQLLTGDVNNDGDDEILLGIIKRTRFDPWERKRLSIFHIDSAHIRPLFLATLFVNELIDFEINPVKPGTVTTFEKVNGRILQGSYAWLKFGLLFKGYNYEYSTSNNLSRISQ